MSTSSLHLPPANGVSFEYHLTNINNGNHPPADEEQTALTSGDTSLYKPPLEYTTDEDLSDQRGTTQNNHNDHDEESGTETVCGLGPFAPSWLQRFASKQSFLLVFCLAWILQGMYHTYFVSVITTIEKLFQIQSKVTGIIMSATEIGQIGSSLLLTYYGGQGHRPKWIAWGMVLFAVSSFTCSLPHFIYGRQLMTVNDLSGLSREPNVCRDPTAFAALTTPANESSTTTLSSVPSILQTCPEEVVSGFRIQPSVTKIVLAIFFISLLGVGIGQTAVYTLGIPYIDDNVASKESPIYFAITIGVRILGPALGFIVGGLCTKLYIDLTDKIDKNDPRWVGAWWLGLVLISALLFVASFAMFAFPKSLSSAKTTPKSGKTEKKRPSIRDFPKTVKRLLKNDILMYRTASSVLHILPIAGFYTFLPKYLESQFRLPTPSANMITGVGGIMVMGIGIIVSGVIILRWTPSARFVAGWIAFTALLYALGMGILMFIGCPMDDIAVQRTPEGFVSTDLTCNKTQCECNADNFTPICGADGRTYLSPCQAGCRNYTESDHKIVEYTECMCIPASTTHSSSSSSSLPFFSRNNDSRINPPPYYGNNATIGYCEMTCTSFTWYIIVFSIFVFIHSTSEVGSMLLILRCVDPRDKAMALGLIQFAIGLFGNVPCPIIYGVVVDSACLLWKMACGEKGACGLYDLDTFRMSYHGTTGAIFMCAFLVDAIVWYKASKINFVDNDESLEEEEEEMTQITKGTTDVGGSENKSEICAPPE